MSGLKQVLEDAAARRVKMGGAASDAVIGGLRSHRRHMSLAFWVIFVVLICAVALGAFGLAWFITDPTNLAAFSGAMGLTVGGAIELMRRAWKEWSQASLLLILVEDATEAQIRTLTDKVIQKL